MGEGYVSLKKDIWKAMAVYRGQQLTLVTATLLVCVLMVSLLVGLEFTNHLNARRKEDKFMAYSKEVAEVNGMMENIEARFEITNLEIQALRNRSLRMAKPLQHRAGANS